ncbi:co-chaperone GroES [Geofilum sp. OHC36d9]|uniref:co-chaperone GroES n=1 Tax=Geofilum sp. OHC36d9 TaxID=3458413 RepID=UPI0040337A5F
MLLSIDKNNLENVIMIGDRVLIKPKSPQKQTKSGLYLPPNIQEKDKIVQGYVVKTGPGYPIPAIAETDEPWKSKNENVQYVPLQPREGDMAVYMQGSSFDIEFNGEKYQIVPQSAILMLIRDEGLFE